MKKGNNTGRQDEETGDEEDEIPLHEHYRFLIDRGQEPVRIDKYLMNRIERISRNRIQKAAEHDFIMVNGGPVKSNYKVRPLDEVVIMLPQPKVEHELLPENIPLSIVYEDDDLIIVNKPAGLVVHPGAGHFTGTLVNGLLYHFKLLPSSSFQYSKEQKATADVRPGLVHRIDKDTSGLLVVAKDEFALAFLAKQFAEHKTKRSYVALVWGDIKNEEGTITGHIGRNTKNRKVMDVFPEGDQGKEAVTHYRVLERFMYVTLVTCTLETGRTHQIRAHMQHIGHPLFNDAAYGGDRIVKGTVFTKYKQFVENCFDLLPRQALHARSLGFIHPSTKKEMFFDSPLPSDMEQVIEKWRSYVRR